MGLRLLQPLLVLGTPGGSRIITAVTHTLLNLIDYGMNVQEAVDAPESVNADAYAAWLFKMKPANAADVDALLDAAGYEAAIG